MFYISENQLLKNKYIDYLKIVGSLSKLFSDSLSPYLYYRAAENIFCLAFEAENLSRSDVAIDAVKGEIGFGLKTFLHGNGKTFQKVAEFNALRTEYSELSTESIVKYIAEARNKRLSLSLEIYGVTKLLYHCLTRSDNKISIFEFDMHKIDTNAITKINKKGNTITFTDSLNEYSFNLSKSTLYQRFICQTSLENIHIDIIDEPYESLTCIQRVSEIQLATVEHEYPFVYLPLYATSSKELEPGLASGINQWNSSGRARDENELYIPVPSWIHRVFANFFPNNIEDNFDLILPNKQVLKAKMCQSGQKGLMSNPNKALGKWVLRDVLKMPVRHVITRKDLDYVGIDSVIVYKLNSNQYKIDFASSGKFEEFKEHHYG